MSTCSFEIHLFPPLDNPELIIRRRSHADPTLLNDFEMATKGNGDPPIPDLRTMEELCEPSLNDGWKLKRLKKKSFAEIQELFDQAMKKANTFVDFKTELMEESSKKAEA
nr:hypothetical protein [Tanacetum cinerariifolium]